MKFGRISRAAILITAAAFLNIACGRSLGQNAGDSGITGSGDATVAPTVSSISPANNATGAYTDNSITVTFNTPVNLGTVTVMTSGTTCSGSVMLSSDNLFTNNCVPLNSNVSSSGTSVTVRVAALLSSNTTYYIRLTTAVAGPTGLVLAAQYNSQFTTGTSVSPLSGEFGADCSAGADTLATVRAAADGTLAPTQKVPGLIVTAIDSTDYFFVQQSGATGPAIYVHDSAHKASTVGVQVGDIVCLEIQAKSQYNNWMQADTLAAIKKTSGGGSVTAQSVTAAVTDDTYESEVVSLTGTLTTKSSTLSGSGYNHTLTYSGNTITIREIQGSGKFDNLYQGMAIKIVTPMTQFSSAYQLYVDNLVGSVSESTTGNFDVTGATSTGSTTVTLTYSNTPGTLASVATNYTANNGLTISGVSVSGNTATLTTSTQTVGQSYTITVANVVRSADSAALTTTTANFTGFVPAASFTAGQVVINEVNIAPTVTAEEYVELYNTTGSPISLNGATLWYKSSGGLPTGKLRTLSGVIPANGYYTLLGIASPTQYTCTGTNEATGSALGLSNTAGAVVLTIDATSPTATTDSNVRDIAQWATNTTNWGEGGTSAPTPASNKTIARAPNGSDTNNNSNDFILSSAANGTCGANNWAGDSTAPTIASTTPADSATGIATNTSIAVAFSESMNVGSVTTSTLYLVSGTNCANTAITGTITASNVNATFTFSPGTLSAATQYSICVKSTVQDAALNALGADAIKSFTTVAPDTTPPTVSSTTPADAATGIAVGTTIAVTFSEAMNTATLTGQISTACSGSIQLSTDNFATCIAMNAATPVFSGGNTVATLTPASALSNSTSYKIRVTTAVQDAAGNALASQFTTATGFTTAAADVTPPTISSTTPANAATGISTGTTIAVTFSEAMSTGTVTAQTSAGACSGSVQVSLDSFANCIAMTASAPTFSGGNTVATLTPTSALTASTTYKIRVTTAVQDAAGNALASQYETATGFTTGSGSPTYLLQEAFNYGATSQALTAATANWTAHSGAGTNSIQYAQSPLSMSGYCSGGGIGSAAIQAVSGEDVNRTYTSQTSGTMYFAALVNFTSIGNATGDYFLHIGTGTTNFYSRIYAKNDGSGGIKFGIARTTDAAQYATGTYATGTTYLLVGKTDAFGTSGNAYLYVLTAATGTEPGSPDATSLTSATSISSYSAVYIRQGTAANMPAGKIGCITVGKTWADLFQ